ncbi:MAG TPA: hypothetical protein VGK20_05100 [Candidatus Binatia bacterium]|jgi:hypothetical protein
MNQNETAATNAKASGPVQRREPNPYGGNFMLTPSLMEYLTPDLTLPEQYYMRHQGDDGMGPERALMYAVLKDAIRSFYKNVGATRRKYKKVLAEAESWLSEDSWDYPFSFLVICETLSIDAVCLRSRLFAWRDAELRRRAMTGEKSGRPSGRSPFPSPIHSENIDHLSIDTDIDLDQDADLGFGGEGDSDFDGMTMSLEDVSDEDSMGNFAA